NSKVKGINDAISNQAGLTDKEKILYNDFSQNPSKYMLKAPSTIYSAGTFGGTVSSSSTEELDPRINLIRDKIYTNLQKSHLDEGTLKNAYYNNISNRPVYEHQVLT